MEGVTQCRRGEGLGYFGLFGRGAYLTSRMGKQSDKNDLFARSLFPSTLSRASPLRSPRKKQDSPFLHQTPEARSQKPENIDESR